MQFFGKMIIFMGYWWIIKKTVYFILNRGLKVVQILKFRIFGRYSNTNVQNTVGPVNYCFQHITVFKTLLCQAKYCVHTYFSYTLDKLVNILRSYHASLCVALYLYIKITSNFNCSCVAMSSSIFLLGFSAKLSFLFELWQGFR
jgi:hypothetical protein